MHRLMSDGMLWRTTRLLGCLCVLLAGCSSIGAKPYQRGVLAKPAMQLDHHALSRSFDEHIYFSKEASSGGAGFGGGGCGCN